MTDETNKPVRDLQDWIATGVELFARNEPDFTLSRGLCDRIAEMVLAQPWPDALTRPAAPTPADDEKLVEAAKPWADFHGDIPDWDHPLRCVYESGIQYAVDLLAKTLKVEDYEVCDGTEDFDGDLGGTMFNIVLKALPKDEHGDEIHPSELPKSLSRAALSTLSRQPAPDGEADKARAGAGEIEALTAENATLREREAGIDARPLSDWHEDKGDVTWWKFPVEEPAWIGTPLDSDWPGYHTHWTPHPSVPAHLDMADAPAVPMEAVMHKDEVVVTQADRDLADKMKRVIDRTLEAEFGKAFDVKTKGLPALLARHRLAERERCAAVAERYPSNDMQVGEAAKGIAHAIRAGKDAEK